jgi:hypothetical protein
MTPAERELWTAGIAKDGPGATEKAVEKVEEQAAPPQAA